MILPVVSLCRAAGWFLWCMKSPDADFNGRHQHGHGQHGGFESQLNAEHLQANVSYFVSMITPLFVCFQLNFDPSLCGCIDTHTPSVTVEENWNLAFILRMWQLPHIVVILAIFHRQPCRLCRSVLALRCAWSTNTHAYSEDIVAAIELQSVPQKSLLALLLLPVQKRSQ